MTDELKPCPFCEGEAGYYLGDVLVSCYVFECPLNKVRFFVSEWQNRPIEDVLNKSLDLRDEQLKDEQETSRKLRAELEELKRHYNTLVQHHKDDHHGQLPMTGHEWQTSYAKQEVELTRLRQALEEALPLMSDADIEAYEAWYEEHGELAGLP